MPFPEPVFSFTLSEFAPVLMKTTLACFMLKYVLLHHLLRLLCCRIDTKKCKISTERSRAAVQALRKVDDNSVRRSGEVQAGLTTRLYEASDEEVKAYLQHRNVRAGSIAMAGGLRRCAAAVACRHKAEADLAWHEQFWARKMGALEPPLRGGRFHEDTAFSPFWHGWEGFYAELDAGPGLCGQRFVTGWIAFAYFHASAAYYAYRYLYHGHHLEDLKEAVYLECAMEVMDTTLAMLGMLFPSLGLRNLTEAPPCTIGYLVAHHVMSCGLLPLAVFIGFPPEKLAWFLFALDGISGAPGCLIQAWCYTPLRSTVLNWVCTVLYQVMNFWFRGPWLAMAACEAVFWVNNYNSVVAGLVGVCFAFFCIFLLLGHEVNCFMIYVGWISKKQRCVIADWDGTSDKYQTDYLEKRAKEVAEVAKSS